jgi:hypothetical protein
MKVLVKESKLFNVIYHYIDSYLNPNEMSWVYGMYDSEDGDLVDYEEDKNFLIFFNGDWDGEEDSDIVFNYFTVDYYSDAPSAQPWKERAPMLEVMGEYGEHLDNIFNEHWEEPMKKWFENNFNLPVKSVST